VVVVFEMMMVFFTFCPTVMLPKSKEFGLKVTAPEGAGVGVGVGVGVLQVESG
jgi:hypothetical protein